MLDTRLGDRRANRMSFKLCLVISGADRKIVKLSEQEPFSGKMSFHRLLAPV